MIYIIALLIALAVTFVTASLSFAFVGRSQSVARLMTEFGSAELATAETAERQRRQDRRQRIQDLLRHLGERLAARRPNEAATKRLLIQAGLRSPSALPIYMGSRVAFGVILAIVALALATVGGARGPQTVAMTIGAGIVGWIGPAFYVGGRARRRRKGITFALADTLDMLVVCVEAGLGLNQALLRVAEEVRHVNLAMAADLALVNLEIRAGVDRTEALRNLGDRTGVEDIRALTAVLIQTDRFGTSIAAALRTQSESLRTKRRQRAEEAAAKTTIKLVPPLVLCIFPAMFAVVLGPAAIQIFKLLAGLRQ